jgi:hypothetical protein
MILKETYVKYMTFLIELTVSANRADFPFSLKD